MGVYSEGDPHNPEKTIAFHWGNNKGSVSFCAMDMATGDCVASFANSMNGPSVFQQIAKPVVGDITPLFQWLSTYCNFNDVNQPEKSEVIATTVHSIHLLADSVLPKPADSTQKMLLLMPSVSTPGMEPVKSQEQTTTAQASARHEVGEERDEEQKSQEFNPTPFSTSPNP
jgi:hypothetical protein